MDHDVAWHAVFSFTCLWPVRCSLSCFKNLSAQNRTRCVYLHDCFVKIKRFSSAGQSPISVLQKWCRENLAQTRSHGTADWTSCTPHKWYWLIQRKTFSICGAGDSLSLGQSHTLAWLNPISTASPSHAVFFLSFPHFCMLSLSYIYRSKLPLFVKPIW